MSLRDALERIRVANGRLTPELVVDAAREPNHPLHQRFEWDDAVAADKYRREQAHELIQSVKLAYANPGGRPTEVRFYHAIRKPTGYCYEPAEDIVRDEITTKIVLADMEREWRQLKKRYEGFREFAQMVRADVGVA